MSPAPIGDIRATATLATQALAKAPDQKPLSQTDLEKLAAGITPEARSLLVDAFSAARKAKSTDPTVADVSRQLAALANITRANGVVGSSSASSLKWTAEADAPAGRHDGLMSHLFTVSSGSTEVTMNDKEAKALAESIADVNVTPSSWKQTTLMDMNAVPFGARAQMNRAFKAVPTSLRAPAIDRRVMRLQTPAGDAFAYAVWVQATDYSAGRKHTALSVFNLRGQELYSTLQPGTVSRDKS